MLDSDLNFTSSTSEESCTTSEVSRLTRHSFYHSGALLLNDEGIVFVGLLVGLASLDLCFILKEQLAEFDSVVSLYHVSFRSFLVPGIIYIGREHDHPESCEIVFTCCQEVLLYRRYIYCL
ncbi:unnamed protein product [Echinostoma caproni]|uniref:Transmembrane protein n=1 Tax=Echinostoma caproni TaxID=27848 RepID=A0A183BB59_9TREM|nr:unnamed protein product [Echinostoma caproni]